MAVKRLGNVSSRVLEYLTANVDVDVNLWDIMEDTGLDEKRVQYAMGHLRDRNGLNITTVVRGSIWRYQTVSPDLPEDPEPEQDVVSFYNPPIFTHVGTTSSGIVVVEDANGTLWKVTEL